jgi:hypothetical protein
MTAPPTHAGIPRAEEFFRQGTALRLRSHRLAGELAFLQRDSGLASDLGQFGRQARTSLAARRDATLERVGRVAEVLGKRLHQWARAESHRRRRGRWRRPDRRRLACQVRSLPGLLDLAPEFAGEESGSCLPDAPGEPLRLSLGRIVWAADLQRLRPSG